MTAAEPPGASSDLRRTAFNAATVGFLIFLFLFSPFTLAFVGWFVDYEDNISHKVHEVTFGVLFAMIFVGVLLQVRDPLRYRVGLLQAIVGAAVLSIVITSTTGWEWPTLFYLAPLGLIAWLHPHRRALIPRQFRPRRSLSVLMLLITGPLIVEFIDELGKARNEVFFHQQHWGGMATYALVILILGYLAAFRIDGWQVLAVTTSLGVALFGVASLVNGFDASAAPVLPAVLAIVWAAAFALYARRVAVEPPQPVPVDPAPKRALREYVRVGAGVFAVFFFGLMGDDVARDFTAPNVPHVITQTSPGYCLSCHLTGEQNAPIIDLEYHGDGSGFGLVCSNCHDLPEVTPTADVTAGPAGPLGPTGHVWPRREITDVELDALASVLEAFSPGRAP